MILLWIHDWQSVLWSLWMFLLFQAEERERPGFDWSDWCWGPVVQVIPVPLPLLPFNLGSKHGSGTFFGLNSFWSQDAWEPPDSMWFLLIVSTSWKALTFTTLVFSPHLLLSLCVHWIRGCCVHVGGLIIICIAVFFLCACVCVRQRERDTLCHGWSFHSSQLLSV